jgi:DNA-binding NtrC family response regulator
MKQGAFRRDLYDRLTFEIIDLPPLRSRLGDVPVLAAHFLARFREEVAGLLPESLAAEALDRLVSYDFPGNVRELKNIVERAAYSAPGPAIGARDIDAALPPARIEPMEELSGFADDPGLPLAARVEAFERAICAQALERARYNQREAAAALGLTYDQFRQRKRKYGLSKD